jgi:hypothetical protein
MRCMVEGAALGGPLRLAVLATSPANGGGTNLFCFRVTASASMKG